MIGAPGRLPGHLVTPRGLSVAGAKLFVVDRSGRVQVFALEGQLLASYTVQEGTKGFPVGILARENGSFMLCDTHYSRLRFYDAAGREAPALGTFGQGPGEFQYPQRAARDRQGRLYVSEYGEGASNRVQVFDPEGRFLRSFGGYGYEPGQFTRAMGIAIQGEEVFVGDISDRIEVFDREGRFLRKFGKSGHGAGELKYPYGLCFAGETLYVCEYGNHRVQRFHRDGVSGGSFGEAGSGPGQFQGPWDIAADAGGRLYVCDSGNHRVVVFDPGAVEWKESAW